MFDPCPCQSALIITPQTKDQCRATLETTSIEQLVWVQGLNVNLCTRWQRLADLLGLKDCAGNSIASDTPLVTCADFKNRLCAALTALEQNGEATAGTLLVGADCKLYSFPDIEPSPSTPVTVTDTNSVDMTLTGQNIKSDVKISPDTGNQVSIHPNGLFVPTPTVSVPTACQQIQAFSTGSDMEPGMFIIGADCQKHIVPAETPVTVVDTQTIDLTLVGQQIQADVKIAPNSIISVISTGLELTCADILNCAPAVTVQDTQSINLTLVGQQVSGQVIISPDSDNMLEVHSNGLYADFCAGLGDVTPSVNPFEYGTTEVIATDCKSYTIPLPDPLNAIDTTTVNLTVTPTTIQADVQVQPGSLLSIGTQGLQVTCESVQDCIGTTSNNFFTYNDPGNRFNFRVSTDPGNILTTGTDTYPFVPAPIITITNSSDCLVLSATGQHITSNLLISPDACNSILCHANGLFVDEGPNGTQGQVDNLGNPSITTQNIVAVQTITVPQLDLSITNPSDCHSATLIYTIRTPNVDIDYNGVPYQVKFLTEANINFPGVLVTGGFITYSEHWLSSSFARQGTPQADMTFIVTVPPSFVGNYSVRWSALGEVGNGNITAGPVSINFALNAI